MVRRVEPGRLERLAWQPATVAVRDMGRELALELKDLRYIPETGQRSWLLRVFTDFEIPWEVHTSAEEGFLLEGEFRNGECLADGPVDGLYRPGGYFYRPAGIAHGGPGSGTRDRRIMDSAHPGTPDGEVPGRLRMSASPVSRAR